MIICMEIDFVIPWVDGSDPKWLDQRKRYSKTPVDDSPCRFRDWDLLPYWFRAVEAYAPWVHRIYFVTWDQVPPWLQTSHPKLHLIDHKDYIPKEYLPTFSSHTIELNFHRIPSLTEHFVYFNDDMFLNAPVKKEDFFRNGLPCDRSVLSTFSPMDVCEPYTHAQCNVMGFINQHFRKREVIRRNPLKWFSLKYGKGLLKNIYCYPFKHFSNFENQHIPSSMLKSTYQRVWELAPDLLHNTCLHKFRDIGDVNQYIMGYYNLCTGQFYPRPSNFGKCYGIGRQNQMLYNDILHGIHKTICINDHPYIQDFEREKQTLLSFYKQKLPKKSSFEI